MRRCAYNAAHKTARSLVAEVVAVQRAADECEAVGRPGNPLRRVALAGIGAQAPPPGRRRKRAGRARSPRTPRCIRCRCIAVRRCGLRRAGSTKAGGTTRRPLVLQTDRGVLFCRRLAQLAAHGGAEMLDINLIREHPDQVRKALRDRQMQPDVVDAILELDEKRRAALTVVEKLKADRNAASREIGQLKDGTSRQEKIEAMRRVGDEIASLDQQVAELDRQLAGATATVPNIPDPRTPLGAGDDDDVLVSSVGEPKHFDFTPKPHWDLGPALALSTLSAARRSPGRASTCLTAPARSCSVR